MARQQPEGVARPFREERGAAVSTPRDARSRFRQARRHPGRGIRSFRDDQGAKPRTLETSVDALSASIDRLQRKMTWMFTGFTLFQAILIVLGGMGCFRLAA